MSDALANEPLPTRLSIGVVSINYAPEPTGISVYSTGMAEYLAERGHQVVVYTAFPYYPAWRKSDADKGRLFRTDVLNNVPVRRSYIFVPKRPTAMRRILHELSFCLSVALNYAFHEVPAITIIVSPPLLLGSLLGTFAKLRGSKVVLHVQDLQPDAAIDLGMLKIGALTRVLFGLERAAYRTASVVSTISEAMRTRIVSKGVAPAKTILFKNWADADLVTSLSDEGSLRAAWKLEDHFVVLYSGNLGVKQGLGTLLDAAVLLKDDPSIAFVIVGDGGQKEELLARARRLELNNVQFFPPVSRERLGQLLATADVSVVPQLAGASDLVLPSKLGNLMASQRPVIVAAQTDSELAAIVLKSRCGLLVRPEDAYGLVNAINVLQSDPHGRAEMASLGRLYAVANLSRESILKDFSVRLANL